MGILGKMKHLHIGGDHGSSKTADEQAGSDGNSRPAGSGSSSALKRAFKTPGSSSGATHQVQSLLGRGGEAETWLSRDLSTGTQCAVKLFKRPVDPEVAHQLVQGINIQAELGEGCSNIITLHQVCLTEQHLAVLMDVALGGNLTSYVSDQYKHAERHGLFLTEKDARYFFRQFITTVAFCHRHHIAHRDLKLDNLLLDMADPPRILLTDFGFAARWGANETPTMRGHLGTLVYSAPELLHGDMYEATAVDVWASGVLLVVSLLGAFPWDVPNQGSGDPRQESDEIWREEMQVKWSDSAVLKEHVHLLSPECRDLLDKIFVTDPKRRITVPQIMEHPFYTQFLTDGNKTAWEKMQAEQAELDAWRQATPIDPAKVTARTNQLEALVREAEKTAGKGGSKRGGPIVRPLQMLRLKGDDVHCISMKRAAVQAAPGTQGRSSLEAPYQ